MSEKTRSAPDVPGVVAVVGATATGKSDLGVELAGPELVEGAGPVEGLGHAGRLDELAVGTDGVDGTGDLGGECLGHLGGAAAQDGQLALDAGVLEPVVEAAALEGVVQLARAVGSEHDDRRYGCRDGAELGDAHRPAGQHLEQERLELVVGAVHLVDQQHGRRLAQCLEHRASEQEPLVEQRLLGLAGVERALPRGPRRGSGLQGPQVQDLAREVPVVERLRGVDALVALEPDQRRPRQLGQRLGERGLAGAGLALEQDRALHLQRQVDDRRELVVGEVAGLPQPGGQVPR